MNLKKIRLKKGIKQKKIAEILKLTQTQVSRIENNESKLNSEQINILCDYLEITADELLGRKPYKEQAEAIIKKTNTNLTVEQIINAKETLDKLAAEFYPPEKEK